MYLFSFFSSYRSYRLEIRQGQHQILQEFCCRLLLWQNSDHRSWWIKRKCDLHPLHSSFRCILSLGFFNFSGRNFVSGEKSAEFFMNSIQNSAHKNSWLHLMFSFLSSYRSYRLESRQRQQFYVGLVFLFWNSLAQPHFGDCQWNSGRPSSHRSTRLPLRHLPPKSKLLTLNS